MTTQDFDKSPIKVKLIYKASKYFMVSADTREEAPKKAYNEFMDSPVSDILSESQIEDFFIETEIEGEEGSDMLHS